MGIELEVICAINSGPAPESASAPIRVIIGDGLNLGNGLFPSAAAHERRSKSLIHVYYQHAFSYNDCRICLLHFPGFVTARWFTWRQPALLWHVTTGRADQIAALKSAVPRI